MYESGSLSNAKFIKLMQVCEGRNREVRELVANAGLEVCPLLKNPAQGLNNLSANLVHEWYFSMWQSSKQYINFLV